MPASLVASFAVSAHSEQSPPKNQEILNKSLNFKIKCPTEAPVPPKWACTWPNNNESTNWKISFEGRLLKLPKDLIWILKFRCKLTVGRLRLTPGLPKLQFPHRLVFRVLHDLPGMDRHMDFSLIYLWSRHFRCLAKMPRMLALLFISWDEKTGRQPHFDGNGANDKNTQWMRKDFPVWRENDRYGRTFELAGI